MMTGNGVMHNGTTVIDDYGRNLDKLKEGDRVAVVRKEPGGTIHFFVNSEDQVGFDENKTGLSGLLTSTRPFQKKNSMKDSELAD